MYQRELSGMFRYLKYTSRKQPSLKLKNLDEYIKSPIVPKMDEFDRKLDFLLAAMRNKTAIPGHTCYINLKQDYPLAFAFDHKELEHLLISLEDDGLIEFDNTNRVTGITSAAKTFRDKLAKPLHHLLDDGSAATFKITRKGWRQAALAKSDSQGFIAIDFHKSMDTTIKTIEDGISDSDYVPMAIKYKDYPETVMEKALGEIRKSMFVIADITNLRPSVFYEAGFAQAIGKPTFYVCSDKFKKKLRSKRKELEFYTKNYKIRFYKTLPQLKSMVITIIEANFPIRKK